MIRVGYYDLATDRTAETRSTRIPISAFLPDRVRTGDSRYSVSPMTTSTGTDLFVISNTQRTMRQLTKIDDFPPAAAPMSTRRYNTYPQWSPDGRWIAFLSADALSKRDLYLIRLDGSDLRRIASDIGAAAPLVVWKPVPEADFAPALLLFLLPPLAGLSLWFLRRRRLG